MRLILNDLDLLLKEGEISDESERDVWSHMDFGRESNKNHYLKWERKSIS